MQGIQFLQTSHGNQVARIFDRLEPGPAEKFILQHIIRRNFFNDLSIIDFSFRIDINGRHRRFQEKHIRCRIFPFSNIIKIAHEAHDFLRIIQFAVFFSLIFQIFDGVLPCEQIHVPLHFSQTHFEAHELALVILEKFAKSFINLIETNSNILHGSIQFIIDRCDEVEAHEVLFGQLLQGLLRGVLRRGAAAVNLILQFLVAAGEAANESAEKSFSCERCARFIRFRHGGHALEDEPVDFLPVRLVRLDDTVDFRIEFRFFVRRKHLRIHQ